LQARDGLDHTTVLLGHEPVAASIRRFGWQQPIVARRTGEVIAGNTRLKAAQQLGMAKVPVSGG
jgi:ParB-like chromosome segregation protein Spo0J